MTGVSTEPRVAVLTAPTRFEVQLRDVPAPGPGRSSSGSTSAASAAPT